MELTKKKLDCIELYYEFITFNNLIRNPKIIYYDNSKGYFDIACLNFNNLNFTTNVQFYTIKKLYDNTYIIGCKFYKI